MIDETEQFAKNLIDFGKTWEIDSITSLGSELLLHTESFDIEQMNLSLEKFPLLIDELKSYYTQNNTN